MKTSINGVGSAEMDSTLRKFGEKSLILNDNQYLKFFEENSSKPGTKLMFNFWVESTNPSWLRKKFIKLFYWFLHKLFKVNNRLGFGESTVSTNKVYCYEFYMNKHLDGIWIDEFKISEE